MDVVDLRSRRLSARQLAAFTAAVALFAILADAALGHGLTWENDPYWTYWVTKTFLIATVFGIGTAVAGVGVGAGAVITLVHTAVLTLYYWSLSPIGLPSHPTWLDLEHTWLTGLPIHFGVVYLGYLTALFLWDRPRRETYVEGRALALESLGLAIATVAVSGTLLSLVLWEFPGATWFLVRLLVTFVLLFVWLAYAGRSVAAKVGGAVVVALAWATYAQFLGPSGLPDLPLRAFATTPPSTTLEWLSYEDVWLIGLPVVLLVTGAILLVLPPRAQLAKAAAVLVVLAVPPLVGALVWPGGTDVRVRAAGPAQIETGAWFSGSLDGAQGSLSLEGVDQGDRVTSLPPHDQLAIRATVAASGTTYGVRVSRPMVDDPLGRFTTWWGVGVDVWHHGRTGIGTDRIPAMRSEVAVFGIGDVSADGKPVATGVPVHVMTTSEGAELDVGDPELELLPGLPDGHLRVLWPAYEGGADDDGSVVAYVVGSAEIVLLLAIALGVARTRRRTRERAAG